MKTEIQQPKYTSDNRPAISAKTGKQVCQTIFDAANFQRQRVKPQQRNYLISHCTLKNLKTNSGGN